LIFATIAPVTSASNTSELRDGRSDVGALVVAELVVTRGR